VNPFDDIAKQVFSEVASVMGEKAVWHTSNGSGDIEGTVLFKDPSEVEQIGGPEQYDYRPATPKIEYYNGTFVGLKELVDTQTEEQITVHGQRYLILSIEKIADGNTYKAHLEPCQNEE
jgi:hypothetical protein